MKRRDNTETNNAQLCYERGSDVGKLPAFKSLNQVFFFFCFQLKDY